MRIAELLEKRRQGWIELERICDSFQSARFPFPNNGSMVSRFSALYRAACTDLSMAEQYQLPPATVEYLHRLVGRAHSQLYRSNPFAKNRWMLYMSKIAPQCIFRDPCVKVAFVVFFGLFTLSAILAWSVTSFPGYAERILGVKKIEMMEVEVLLNKKNSYSSYLYSKTIIMVYNCNSNIYFFIF